MAEGNIVVHKVYKRDFFLANVIRLTTVSSEYYRIEYTDEI